MESTQQAQLLQVQSDVRSSCEATAQLNSKVDHLHKGLGALQQGLSAVLKLLTQRGHADSSSVAGAEEVPRKRARAESAASASSPLDDDEILGTVLGYVGYGEYFYVAGVCRRWRGCYISYCHAKAPAFEEHKLRTLRRALVSTAGRLQLALNNGVKLTVLETPPDVPSFLGLAYTVPRSSQEPIAVLSLLRVYGYQWDSDLYVAAAEEGNIELIKWLHQVQCPTAAFGRIANRCCSRKSCTDVSILQWLHSQRPEWFNSVDGSDHLGNKTWLLSMASEYCNFAVSQWLRCELNAEWPAIEGIICTDNGRTIVPDWPAEAVVWALDNGLEFESDCSKLDPEKQPRFSLRKQEATVLWHWLHKESNRHRCTCTSAVS
eukprot:10466-Heterococcus_DN1.PRE.2